MDQRTPLSQGASVRHYIIDKRIGDGASCLVYEAHYLDSGNHRKEIILKECYPYNAGITRVGNMMIWSDPTKKREAFYRFKNAYEVAAKIQNTEGAQSVSVYSLDRFAENGTQYVATIPNGNSYDKNESEDIADILRTALALTNAVGLYHKAGYLHLDIKPSNFIASEDQTGKGKNIILFDVDTVVSQEDVRNGNLRSISYSKEFAAPEQKMQQIKKISPATDLFAVGAVLFERMMNRPVKCFDSGLFATWEYDSRFDVKKVNPKVKRLLTEVFHKTLAANVKRRYQSADELAGALEELLKIVDGNRPYIYSPNYVSTCNFVGRSEELAELREALTDKNQVFVKGAGGIGKTELVRKYVSLHQDEYDAVVFMLYNGSVSECLNQIEIIGIDEAEKNNSSVLKEICDEKVLLILDNYDVAPNESKDLNELFDLNCKIIVTTRTDFSERNPNANIIVVLGLPPIALRVIFENESGLTLSDSEFEDMQTILHIGQECTYFWSMIARLAKEGAYTISEIVEKVNAGLDDLEGSEDVFDTKDGNHINTTVAAAMLGLFKLDEFNDKDFEVLKAMYFLDCLNMDKRQIKEMLAFSENKLMNSFNVLVKKGYVQRLTVDSREVYRISDVLRNVLEYKEELDISETGVVTSFIEKKLVVNKTDMDRLSKSDVCRDRVYNIFACLFSIFSNMQWSVSGNAVYCINTLYNSSMGEKSVFRFARRGYATVVLDHIKDFTYKSEIAPLIKTKAIVIRVSWYCSLHIVKLWTGQHEEAQGIAEKIEELFYAARNEMTTNQIADLEMVDYLCKPIVKAIERNYKFCVDHYYHFSFSSKIIQNIFFLSPSCLQNEYAHISHSFKVVCLMDSELEKLHLKNTLNKLKREKHDQIMIIAYTAIIMIALNGKNVTLAVDDELKMLRSQVLSVCEKMFTVSKGRIMLNSKHKEISELISEIKLLEKDDEDEDEDEDDEDDEDDMIEQITVGVNRLYQSITSEKSRHYRPLKDKNGNQNVVNRAEFTFEEYLEQLTGFQKIVSSCVYEGDDSFRLSDSITSLQQLIRSKGIKDDPFVKKAMDDIKETGKELAIIMAGKRGEGRIEHALSFVERPDLTVFKNKYITDGEEETEIDTILVTDNGIVILEIKTAKKDITISQDGRLLYENQISYHDDCIGEKMEKKRRLLKYQIEKEMKNRGIDSFGKPVRIESRIVFSTPYKTRIRVTDLYKKERFCFGNQLKHIIENYYSGTCYESEDLQMLNEIIGSMESNKKRFQQKLDFAKINREFAQLMELLTKQEVAELAETAPILLKRDDSKESSQKRFYTFGKIAVSALFAAASIVSCVALSKSYK